MIDYIGKLVRKERVEFSKNCLAGSSGFSSKVENISPPAAKGGKSKLCHILVNIFGVILVWESSVSDTFVKWVFGRDL